MKPVRFTLLLITLAVLLVLSATGSALSGAVRIPLEALPELLKPAAQPDILESGQSGYGRSDRLPGLCRQAVPAFRAYLLHEFIAANTPQEPLNL